MVATPLADLHLSSDERAIIDTIPLQKGALIETLLTWSSQNSGSHNAEGLSAMRALLRAYAARLDAKVTDKGLTQGEYVTPAGEIKTVDYAPALEITKRPNAPIQLVLTGHYDTVFPKEFHFQEPRYLDDDTVNGPGTADMKGGIFLYYLAKYYVLFLFFSEKLSY